MSAPLNLKMLERQAFRRTYQDGLYEVYLGGMLASFAGFAFTIFPGDTFEWLQALGLYLFGAALSGLVYWLGKRYVTRPRIGQVNFGPRRQKRKRDLILALSVIVGVQVLAVMIQFGLLASPVLHASLAPFLGDQNRMGLVVAVAAMIFVAPGMLLVAYFTEIPRGYYHAVTISLAIFLMILLNQAWWMVIGGALILVPGVVQFIRFLRQYPLPPEDVDHASS